MYFLLNRSPDGILLLSQSNPIVLNSVESMQFNGPLYLVDYTITGYPVNGNNEAEESCVFAELETRGSLFLADQFSLDSRYRKGTFPILMTGTGTVSHQSYTLPGLKISNHFNTGAIKNIKLRLYKSNNYPLSFKSAAFLFYVND